MREPDSKAQPAPPSGTSTEPAEGGALWALLVGGAILVVAALLIFWPSGDAGTAAGAGGKGKQGGVAGQHSLAQGQQVGPDGQAMGVAARDYDPNRSGKSHINPILVPQGSAGTHLAPPRPHKPEPTSFPTASAEIEYWEKKLTVARDELKQRTMFWERAQKMKEDARTSEQIDNAERRGKVVEQNYLDQKKKVEELEKKVADLKEKQRQSGNP